MRRYCSFIFLLFLNNVSSAQSTKVYGKITNTKLEPLAFASIEVREIKAGTITKEDGTYAFPCFAHSFSCKFFD